VKWLGDEVTYDHPMLMLRISGAIWQLSSYACMICTGTALHLPLCFILLLSVYEHLALLYFEDFLYPVFFEGIFILPELYLASLCCCVDLLIVLAA
jgi:hypothetical protein